MNVLILGANGMLGPHVVKALEREHNLRLTDINDLDDTPQEYLKLDVSDLDGVVEAAEGMDAIINLSVLRQDRRLAFDVNARGTYNAMAAAAHHRIPRVINTGPHFTIAGPTYERLDYRIGPDAPPQPGTLLYALTKSLGQEACRVFSETFPVHVITLLFYHFHRADDSSEEHRDIVPFMVTWESAAEAFSLALSVELEGLPSRCEAFFVLADMPHERFSNEKTKRILGWRPDHKLDRIWRKASVGDG